MELDKIWIWDHLDTDSIYCLTKDSKQNYYSNPSYSYEAFTVNIYEHGSAIEENTLGETNRFKYFKTQEAAEDYRIETLEDEINLLKSKLNLSPKIWGAPSE